MTTSAATTTGTETVAVAARTKTAVAMATATAIETMAMAMVTAMAADVQLPVRGRAFKDVRLLGGDGLSPLFWILGSAPVHYARPW
jgi:hypothetical protein